MQKCFLSHLNKILNLCLIIAKEFQILRLHLTKALKMFFATSTLHVNEEIELILIGKTWNEWIALILT